MADSNLDRWLARSVTHLSAGSTFFSRVIAVACMAILGCRPSEPKPARQSHTFEPSSGEGAVAGQYAIPDTFPTALKDPLHDADKFVENVFQRVLGTTPHMGWLAPGRFIAEEQHPEVYIWSTDSVIMPVPFARSLSGDDHAKLAAESHLACDSKGPLAEYTDSVSATGVRHRAFYTSAAPPPDTRAGLVPRRLTSADLVRAHTLLGARSTSDGFLDTAFAASATGPFYSIDAAYDSSHALRVVALILHDSSGAVVARQMDDATRFDCDGCGEVTSEAGLERVYDVRNIFVIPGFPFPVLLLDTSTVEGRALSFVTFTPDGYLATYRVYEYVVNCIVGDGQ